MPGVGAGITETKRHSISFILSVIKHRRFMPMHIITICPFLVHVSSKEFEIVQSNYLKYSLMNRVLLICLLFCKVFCKIAYSFSDVGHPAWHALDQRPQSPKLSNPSFLMASFISGMLVMIKKQMYVPLALSFINNPGNMIFNLRYC